MSKLAGAVRGTSASLDQKMAYLVVSWILMIPLLYYAGGFWWETQGLNNRFQGDFKAIVDPSHTARNAVTTLAIFVILTWLFLPHVRSIAATCRDNLVLAALPVLAIASFFWSQLPSKSFLWGVCLAASTLFAFFLARRFSPEQQMQLLVMFGWLCITLSIVLILFFPSIGLAARAGGLGAWKGVYGTKNNLSRLTLFLLLPAFYLPAKTLLSKLSRVAYIGLSILIILMSQSAGGVVGLSCLLAFVIVTKVISKFRSADRAIIIVMTIAVALMPVAACLIYLPELLHLLGKDTTLSGRTAIWAASVMAIMKRPLLGYGYMAFWRGLNGESANVVLATGWGAPGAHNGFLQVWLDLGAAGVALVVFPLVKALRDAASCLRDRESSNYLWYLGIVVLTVITNLDESPMAQPSELTWVLFILACVELSERARRLRNGPHG